jgi:hypothetical protein
VTFDADEITQAVREQAARHEALHERLSRVVGPIADYGQMTTPEMAAYGLKKLNLEVPDATDDPVVTALEFALRGRYEDGLGGSMDSAGHSFVDRYIQGSANRSMDGDADAGESALDRYLNST